VHDEGDRSTASTLREVQTRGKNTHTNIYTQSNGNLCKWGGLHANKWTCVSLVCVHIIYIYIYIYMCVCVCVCVCMYTLENCILNDVCWDAALKYVEHEDQNTASNFDLWSYVSATHIWPCVSATHIWPYVLATHTWPYVWATHIWPYVWATHIWPYVLVLRCVINISLWLSPSHSLVQHMYITNTAHLSHRFVYIGPRWCWVTSHWLGAQLCLLDVCVR
jgi:hypothetical protein